MKEGTGDRKIYVKLAGRKMGERKQLETKQSQESVKLP